MEHPVRREGPTRWIRLTVLAAAIVVVVGCAGREPEPVWVPAEGFTASLTIGAETPAGGAVAVGEPIVLHAERTTGPWRQVARSSLADDACWLVRPPEPVEHDVQARVRWIVEPDGSAVFNLPQADDLELRTVTFESPGTYTLRARTHTWCGPPVDSEVIEIPVVGPDGAS